MNNLKENKKVIKVSLSYMTKLLNDLRYYENESHCGWPTYQHELEKLTEEDVLTMYKEGYFETHKN